MRGRFKLLILTASISLGSLLTLAILNPEENKCEQVFSCFVYPFILVNHQIKTFLERQGLRLSESYLLKRNQKLTKMAVNLQAQNIALMAQNKYYLEHQELIDFSKRYEPGVKILAQIFFKNLSNQEHYAFLDKGEMHNIQIGMVAVYKNFLIGKVTCVYPKYCKIALLTDRNCKIAVYDEKTGAVGICCGKNDCKQIMLSYVSHLQKINIEDMLISSGNGEIFPQGFGVGKISDLNLAGMYYEAHANLLIDLENLDSCYLIAANKS